MAASLSQPFDSIVIPSIEPSDPEPVRSSLALARTDYARGDIREALRHLRRAAEGADEAGSELRAVALARAAADLATAVGASQAPPPVTARGPTAAVSSPPTSMVRASDEPALRQLLETGRAVRVVVKRSTRDEELYVLRRAQDGAPPLGTREAVIVLLEPDDDFFKATE
jgi:hypothetical protein